MRSAEGGIGSVARVQANGIGHLRMAEELMAVNHIQCLRDTLVERSSHAIRLIMKVLRLGWLLLLGRHACGDARGIGRGRMGTFEPACRRI